MDALERILSDIPELIEDVENNKYMKECFRQKETKIKALELRDLLHEMKHERLNKYRLETMCENKSK